MSQAEELLNSLTADDIMLYTAEPETEGHIIIGNDRFITVPDSLKRIAVQYDHNIETVTFDCPRYWDGIDMSTMKIYINYKCQDGSVGSYLATNVSVDATDDNIIHFDWVISRNVTSAAGKISFLVCIKTTDENGMETVHWNSEINSVMTVSAGLECDAIVKSYPDVITYILKKLESLGVNAAGQMIPIIYGTGINAVAGETEITEE